MLTIDSHGPARHARRIVLIVATFAIAMMAVVPVLVLATQQQGRVPSIRLTRGFDAPPEKCHVSPPCAVVESIVRDSPPCLPAHPAAVVLSELIPDSSPALSLDPLRGPPAPPLA